MSVPIKTETMEYRLIQAVRDHAEAIREEAIENAVKDFEKNLRRELVKTAVDLTRFYSVSARGEQITLTVNQPEPR